MLRPRSYRECNCPLPVTILGISCWYHDAAACLLRDGAIVAAAQEERFTRIKHDASFPKHAIEYCLQSAGITAQDLGVVAYYEKPFLKFERLLESYLSYAPAGLPSFLKAMPLWLRQKLWIPDLLRKELDYEGPLVFAEHHESHAASAFYPSPFEEAAILTTDGVGEWTTTAYGMGEGADLRLMGEVHFPHSLGLLYSAVTAFCGFRVNSGEYKLMGLAPFGKPTYTDVIRRELIDLRDDGSFRLNMKYFTFPVGLRMTGRRFARLFGGPPRPAESALTKREMDLACSLQHVLEDVLLHMARHVQRATQSRNLCLAGGVALNCVANGKLLRSGVFDRIWIQPAAGDAGGALGAALMAWYRYLGNTRQVTKPDSMRGAYLGSANSDEDIRTFLQDQGADYWELKEAELCNTVASLLAEGQVVGWFQGRMEFGPRALGARSILADPRGKDVQRLLNLKIKFRESFRPFAPSVPADRSSEYFDVGASSPYMLLVGDVREANCEGEGLDRLGQVSSPVPAVTHVNGSARVHTVAPEVNPRFYRLLRAFEAATGCPVLVNTSFNVRGEPIVRTPEEAWACFRHTHMDVLVLGRFVVRKSAESSQPLTADEIIVTYGLD